MQDLPERDGPDALKRSLRDDQSGNARSYLTTTLPIIIGLGLLAVDVSRLYILNSSLTDAAGAFALAMAVELDHPSDALTRAVRATDNLAIRYHCTGVGDAGRPAGPVPDIAVSFLGASRDFLLSRRLADPTRASFPISAKITVTAEGRKALWGSS